MNVVNTCRESVRQRPKASHLHPDVPRSIQRWNGHAWEPVRGQPHLGSTHPAPSATVGRASAPAPASRCWATRAQETPPG
ncbi:DUF6087 family protein [Streptomyces chartreusis]